MGVEQPLHVASQRGEVLRRLRIDDLQGLAVGPSQRGKPFHHHVDQVRVADGKDAEPGHRRSLRARGAFACSDHGQRGKHARNQASAKQFHRPSIRLVELCSEGFIASF